MEATARRQNSRSQSSQSIHLRQNLHRVCTRRRSANVFLPRRPSILPTHGKCKLPFSREPIWYIPEEDNWRRENSKHLGRLVHSKFIKVSNTLPTPTVLFPICSLPAHKHAVKASKAFPQNVVSNVKVKNYIISYHITSIGSTGTKNLSIVFLPERPEDKPEQVLCGVEEGLCKTRSAIDRKPNCW